MKRRHLRLPGRRHELRRRVRGPRDEHGQLWRVRHRVHDRRVLLGGALQLRERPHAVRRELRGRDVGCRQLRGLRRRVRRDHNRLVPE